MSQWFSYKSLTTAPLTINNILTQAGFQRARAHASAHAQHVCTRQMDWVGWYTNVTICSGPVL